MIVHWPSGARLKPITLLGVTAAVLATGGCAPDDLHKIDIKAAKAANERNGGGGRGGDTPDAPPAKSKKGEPLKRMGGRG